MLTPTQIFQMNAVTGLNVGGPSAPGSGSSRAAEIRSMAQSAAAPQAAAPNPIADQFKSGVDQVKEGASQINKGGTDTTDGVVAGLEGGLKVGSGIATAALSPLAPVTKPIGDAVNAAGKFNEEHPMIQTSEQEQEKFANSPVGTGVARVAEDLSNAGNIAGTIAGVEGVGKGAPKIIDATKGAIDDASKARAESQAAAATQKAQQAAVADKTNKINIISPKLTPTEMNNALATGKVVNRVSPKTKTVTPDFSVDPHIQQLHDSTSHLINPKASTITENLDNVRQGIADTSEKEVKPLLEKNPVPFNFENLRGALDNVQPSSAIKADPAAFKNYNRIKEELLSVAEKSLRESQTAGGKGVNSMTDLNDLWTPNKGIDSYIQNQLGNTALETPAYTGIKAASQDLRNASRQFMSDSLRYPGQMETLNKINQFIRQMPSTVREKLTPESIKALQEQFGLKSTPESNAAADTLDQKMSQLHDMFEVRDNLSPKARLEQGTNALSRYLKTHPVTAKFGKAAAQTAGFGAGLHLIP